MIRYPGIPGRMTYAAQARPDDLAWVTAPARINSEASGVQAAAP